MIFVYYNIIVYYMILLFVVVDTYCNAVVMQYNIISWRYERVSHNIIKPYLQLLRSLVRVGLLAAASADVPPVADVYDGRDGNQTIIEHIECIIIIWVCIWKVGT